MTTAMVATMTPRDTVAVTIGGTSSSTSSSSWPEEENRTLIRYDDVTWEWLEARASPRKIETVLVRLPHGGPVRHIETADDFTKMKWFLSCAEQIQEIRVCIRQEPQEASGRQCRIARVACRAAYKSASDLKVASIQSMLASAGLSLLHMGRETESSEYVIAECPEYNEVYIAYRGTANFEGLFSSASLWVEHQLLHGGVHGGFFQHMQVVDSGLLHWLLQQSNGSSKKNVILCGHSLGGAAAAVRLITMLPDLESTEALVDGRIRVIGFGTPLFATKPISRYVSETLNCRNLFHFVVADGDPVPGVLSSLSQLVSQSTVQDKNHNVDFALDILRALLPSTAQVSEEAADRVRKLVAKKLAHVDSMFYPLGKFVFISKQRVSSTTSSTTLRLMGRRHFSSSSSSSSSSEVTALTLTDTEEIKNRLQKFKINKETIFHHNLIHYAARVKSVYNNVDIREVQETHVLVPTLPKPTVNVEISGNALWIQIFSCPMHLQWIKLLGIGCKPQLFLIHDMERKRMVYDQISTRDSSIMPDYIRHASLKIELTPEQCRWAKAAVEAADSKIEFIPALGSGADTPCQAAIFNPKVEDRDDHISHMMSISRIYYGTLLCSLMEMVQASSAQDRLNMEQKAPIPALLHVAEAVGETSASDFLSVLRHSHNPSEAIIQSNMNRAHKVAEAATHALALLMLNNLEIRVKWSIQKKMFTGVCVVLTIAGVVTLVAVGGGAVIPGVTVALEKGIISFGAASMGGTAATVSGGAGIVSLIKNNDNVVEERYEEKLKVLMKILEIKFPIRLETEALEKALVEGLETCTFKDLKFDALHLKEESIRDVERLARMIVRLREIRLLALERKLITLVGCKNAGKSTGAGMLFSGIGASTGASQSTVFPTPYDWSSSSNGERKGLVIDFPGATEVMDETTDLATKFLGIGGAGAFCLVFINPFVMASPDCKVVKNAKEQFGANHILIVCTNCDAKDANGEYQVEKFGGAEGIQNYVVGMLRADPYDTYIDVSSVLVGSFVKDADNLHDGVMNPTQLQTAVHNYIWPTVGS